MSDDQLAFISGPKSST